MVWGLGEQMVKMRKITAQVVSSSDPEEGWSEQQQSGVCGLGTMVHFKGDAVGLL